MSVQIYTSSDNVPTYLLTLTIKLRVITMQMYTQRMYIHTHGVMYLLNSTRKHMCTQKVHECVTVPLPV